MVSLMLHPHHLHDQPHEFYPYLGSSHPTPTYIETGSFGLLVHCEPYILLIQMYTSRDSALNQMAVALLVNILSYRRSLDASPCSDVQKFLFLLFVTSKKCKNLPNLPWSQY